MKYYSYENFRDDTNDLLQTFQGYKPEVIIGIARGGLTLAHCLAEGLDIRDVQTLRTELYDDTNKRESISLFGECNLANVTEVLIVDDIADSGETLLAVVQHLEKLHPHVKFQSATLYYKKTSIIEPTFWVKEANDWIDFFWERDFLQES